MDILTCKECFTIIICLLLFGCNTKAKEVHDITDIEAPMSMCHQINQKGITILSASAIQDAAAIVPDTKMSDDFSGMILINGGDFGLGGKERVDQPKDHPGSQPRADEFPNVNVTISSFWMDETEVTNAQFSKFIEATGYITTAERPISLRKSCLNFLLAPLLLILLY